MGITLKMDDIAVLRQTCKRMRDFVGEGVWQRQFVERSGMDTFVLPQGGWSCPDAQGWSWHLVCVVYHQFGALKSCTEIYNAALIQFRGLHGSRLAIWIQAWEYEIRSALVAEWGVIPAVARSDFNGGFQSFAASFKEAFFG